MKKKILPKDSLKKVIAIMEYIEENLEKVGEKQIISKFGISGMNLFSRYCLGGDEPYASSDSKNIKLNQMGVRKLHELRKILAQENRDKQIGTTNKMIAFTGAALAFLAVVNIVVSSQSFLDTKLIWNQLVIQFTLLLILIGSLIFMIINFIEIVKSS